MIEPNRETYIKIPTSLGIRIVDLLEKIVNRRSWAEIHEDTIDLAIYILIYMKTYDETDD